MDSCAKTCRPLYALRGKGTLPSAADDHCVQGNRRLGPSAIGISSGASALVAKRNLTTRRLDQSVKSISTRKTGLSLFGLARYADEEQVTEACVQGLHPPGRYGRAPPWIYNGPKEIAAIC
jgi:hypothetical protein